MLNKQIVHIINSKAENAILIIGDGSHEWRRYPKENFAKNENLINIFFEDLKDLSNTSIVLFD